jgi:hypothetical protein
MALHWSAIVKDKRVNNTGPRPTNENESLCPCFYLSPFLK